MRLAAHDYPPKLDVSVLLADIQNGKREAWDALIGRVYADLPALAHRQSGAVALILLIMLGFLSMRWGSRLFGARRSLYRRHRP
ncbi:MAG TPA: hypothetical protein VFD82_22155 [Planctomycetota bacterium]|nr:hypothetical protein [Planctomycetota bacterium]